MIRRLEGLATEVQQLRGDLADHTQRVANLTAAVLPRLERMEAGLTLG